MRLSVLPFAALLTLATLSWAALLPLNETLAELLPPLAPVLELIGNVGNQPPPTFLWTPHPSPECAAINQGELKCCYATVAGDLPLVQWLAGVYGYQLNPNDVNGIYCDDDVATCAGVTLCCQVTALNPLLSLYCQDS